MYIKGKNFPENFPITSLHFRLQEVSLFDEIPDVVPFPRKGSKFHEPPNPGYRVRAVPTRYPDQVQLSAVLRPLYGRLPARADIEDATAWARYFWRHRVQELVEAGWPPLARDDGHSRLANAMRCPVTFVITYFTKAGTKLCRFRQICPFCWAREVRRQWLKVDAAFFPRPIRKGRVRMVDTDPEPAKSSSFTHSVKDGEPAVKSPYDLVRRVFTYRLRPTYPIKIYGQVGLEVPALPAWLDGRIRGHPYPELYRLPEIRPLLTAAGPVAGLLEAIDIHPVVDPAAPWEVQVRQLILASAGGQVPTSLPRAATAKPRHHIVIRRPSRRTVVSAVARTFRYPTWLLDPDQSVDDVITYLNAREGRRLVASYGCFRARNA